MDLFLLQIENKMNSVLFFLQFSVAIGENERTAGVLCLNLITESKIKDFHTKHFLCRKRNASYRINAIFRLHSKLLEKYSKFECYISNRLIGYNEN